MRMRRIKGCFILVTQACMFHDTSNQRIAVGMDARCGQSDEDVTRLEMFTGDGLPFWQPTKCGAREVKFRDNTG